MSVKCLLLVVCVLCIATLVRSDDRIREGARVRMKSSSELRENGAIVLLNQDRWITGKLLKNELEVLTVETKRDVQMKLPVNSLSQLQVSHGKARKKGVLIGAGVGAAVGLIYGAADTAKCNSQGGWFCGLAYAVTVLTIPAGALIGFAAAPERWADVPLKEVQGSGTSATRSFQLTFQW